MKDKSLKHDPTVLNTVQASVIWWLITEFANIDYASPGAPVYGSKSILPIPLRAHFNLWMVGCAIESFLRRHTRGERFPDPGAVPRSKNIREQSEVRRILLWLCQPDEHADDERWAVDFLSLHGLKHLKGELEELVPHHFPNALWIESVKTKDSFDLFCAFILDRHRRFMIDEIDKFPPVRVCGRPGCGKFLFSRNRGRKAIYHSDDCRMKVHNLKKSPAEKRDWAEHMRMHRFEKAQREIESLLKKLLEMKPAELNRELLKDMRFKKRLDKAQEKFRGNKKIKTQIDAVYERASS